MFLRSEEESCELSRNPKSLFSAFLSVMAETGLPLSEEHSSSESEPDMVVDEETMFLRSEEESCEDDNISLSENSFPSSPSRTTCQMNKSFERVGRRSSSISQKRGIDDKTSTSRLMTNE